MNKVSTPEVPTISRKERISELAKDPEFRYWMRILLCEDLPPGDGSQLMDDMWDLLVREKGAEPKYKGPVFGEAENSIREQELGRG